MKVPAPFSLIETMRSEPGTGVLRSKLHRTRLGNSARKLGFAGYEAAWSAVLEKADGIGETSRLRLELFSDGHFHVAIVPFALQGDDTVWTVRIASRTRLDSGGPLLRHKTSMRKSYDAARAEFAKAEADEVLLLNEKSEVCEGTITNVFVESGDGVLLTPPLASGCLAGILRTSLLCSKKARVGKIGVGDLSDRTFYVGNSLRGLIRAKLLK